MHAKSCFDPSKVPALFRLTIRGTLEQRSLAGGKGNNCICSTIRNCVAKWGFKSATPHACHEQSLICSDTGALPSRAELTNQTR
jgi:hypothetical protein